MAEQHIRATGILSDVVARITAAATAVHIALGPGWEKIVYQRALALELPEYKLHFERGEWVDLVYRGAKVGRTQVDFVIEDILVETEVKPRLDDLDLAHAQARLKASGYDVGVLLNFGSEVLQVKRFK